MWIFMAKVLKTILIILGHNIKATLQIWELKGDRKMEETWARKDLPISSEPYIFRVQ
jgi:hypothetical protein